MSPSSSCSSSGSTGSSSSSRSSRPSSLQHVPLVDDDGLHCRRRSSQPRPTTRRRRPPPRRLVLALTLALLAIVGSPIVAAVPSALPPPPSSISTDERSSTSLSSTPHPPPPPPSPPLLSLEDLVLWTSSASSEPINGQANWSQTDCASSASSAGEDNGDYAAAAAVAAVEAANAQASTNGTRTKSKRKTTPEVVVVETAPVGTAGGAKAAEGDEEIAVAAPATTAAESPSQPSEAAVAPDDSTGDSLATTSAAEGDSEASAPAPFAAPSASSKGSTTTVFVNPAPPVPTPAAAVPTPFPQPFDTSLSLNFTNACLSSLSIILSSSTFKACRPLSLLLSSSTSFSKASTNLTRLTALVQATLETVPSAEDCQFAMDGFARSLEEGCKPDLRDGNSVAKEALTGLNAYGFMRQAGGLVSEETGAYCYVEAVGEKTADDLFYWQLFTGARLLSKIKPTCSSCIKKLLLIYANNAANSSLPLSVSFGPAVDKTNAVCGAGWAPSIIAAQASGTVTSSASSPSTSIGGSRQRWWAGFVGSLAFGVAMVLC